MFKKLIANLPFNPSLVTQVSFYAKRIQEETSLRRMGFGLIALAMFIQMFAVMAPPEKSLAASSTHILNGIQTRDDILRAWDRAGSDIPAIYGKFGLTRDDIAKLPNNPNTSIVSSATGADYWTIGRVSLTNFTNVAAQYKVTEIPLDTGPTTVYMRELKAWNIVNKQNTYRAFTGKKASDGSQYWILVDCGNYTQIGKFTPKKPLLEIRKTIVGGTSTKNPGDTFTYRIEYRNRVKDSLAENVLIQDTLDLANYDVVNTKALQIVGGRLRQGAPNLGFSDTYSYIDLIVRLKNPFPSASNQTCNTAKISSSNAPDAISNPSCVTVRTPCQVNPNATGCKPTPPVVVCSLVDTSSNKTTRAVSFKTMLQTTNASQTIVYGYNYTFGDDSKVLVHTSTSLTDTAQHTYPAGDFTAKVAVSYGVKGETAKQEALCESPITFEADKPFGESKTVKNITQNLEGDKAVNSKVKAGDVLEYTLTTTNSQDYARNNVVISDYVGDILDYADVDMAFLKANGGTYNDTTKKVSFTIKTISANSDFKSAFRVTLKNPIPATNQPSNVSGTFDCKIANKYGNEITLNVTCPMVKGVETLPNTGPGTSAVFGFLIVTVVGYFFARARLLSKEMMIIKSDYAPTGGL